MKKLFKRLSLIAAFSTALFGHLQAYAAFGDLYVGGLSDNVVYKLTPPSPTAVPFAQNITQADSVAFDPKGNLFVSGSNAIWKVTRAGTVTSFASAQNGETFMPGGLAFDAAGNLYATNTATGVIYRYNPSGARTTFASGLNVPFGLAFDKSGNLYVSEVNTGSVLKFAPGGGAPVTFSSGFVVPRGLAFDSSGNLYVAETGASRVSKIGPTGGTPTLFASLLQPLQLAFDPSGTLFVSTANHEISTVAPDGTATVFAPVINAGGLAFEHAIGLLSNISTRASVQTGDRVEIGGFIITGSNAKTVLVRALGPTLGRSPFNVPGALQDPFLELHDSSSTLIGANDDWASDANAGQIPPGLQPPDTHESAMVRTLQPGNYTAILHSADNTSTGIGLVEVYDIDTSNPTFLGNISTRGFVGTGDSVMIGGFIVGTGNNARVLIRALGPTLSQPPFNVAGTLADPTLQLLDANGNQIAFNNDWRDTQAAEIQATGNPPPNNVESAIVATLPPNNYTAIVQGNGGGTGIGLVEVYNLR